MYSLSVFDDFPVIETDRLILRKITYELDSDILFDGIYGNYNVSKFDTIKIVSKEDTHITTLLRQNTIQNKIEQWDSLFYRKKGIVWGIELKRSNKLIGFRLCRILSHFQVYTECKLMEDYWGKGIMFEATKAILDYFKSINIIQVITYVNVENRQALRLMEKLNFKYSTTDKFLISQFIDGEDKFDLNNYLNDATNNQNYFFIYNHYDKFTINEYDVGVYYFLKNNYIDAYKYFNRSLSSNLKFQYAKVLMGFSKLCIDDFHNSLDIFNQVDSDKIPLNHLGKAFVYRSLGKYEKSYNECIEYMKYNIYNKDANILLDFVLKAIERKSRM